MEEYTNIVTLSDENGDEIDFEILDVVPYAGEDYAVLLPVDDDSDDPEAVILRIVSKGEEEELVGIEDEAVLKAVFELFLERNREEFSAGS